MTLDHEAARDSKPPTAVDAKDAEVRENKHLPGGICCTYFSSCGTVTYGFNGLLTFATSAYFAVRDPGLCFNTHKNKNTLRRKKHEHQGTDV